MCQHKKHKKKSKKRKHHKDTSDHPASVQHCDQLTDVINPSIIGDALVSHNHGRTFSTSETFNDSQSELRSKKSHKRKRNHDHEALHCKYQKVDCDNVTALEMNLQKECRSECSSEKHSSSETVPVQSNTAPDVQHSIDSHRQKHKKKKKKEGDKFASASGNHGMSFASNDECKELHKSKKKKRPRDATVIASEDSQTVLVNNPEDISRSFHANRKKLHKRKKKKRSKETKCKDVESQSDFSQDLLKQSSSQLQVPSMVIVSDDDTGPGDAAFEASEDSQAVLVNRPDGISSSYGKRLHKRDKKKRSKETKCTEDVEPHSDAALNTGKESPAVVVNRHEDVSLSYDAHCKHLHKHKKKKKSTETRCEEGVESSQDLLKQSSSHLQVPSVVIISDDDTGPGGAALEASEDSQAVLVNRPEGISPSYDADSKHLRKHKKKKRYKKTRCKEDVEPNSDAALTTSEQSPAVLVTKLENISPEETKYVETVCETVYNEHKLSKSKHRKRKSNAHFKTQIADSHPAVLSETNVCSEVTSDALTTKSATDQSMNPADVLNVLHAENSLSYLKTIYAVKEAGEKI